MKWFYCIPELIQRFDKKNRFIFYPVQERQTNWNVTGYQVPDFMIIRYNRLNLLWIIKCQFLRTMEPLMQTVTPRSVVSDLVLHCLLMSLLWDAKYKWANGYLGIYMPPNVIAFPTRLLVRLRFPPEDSITKACLYNFDPLKPHFYIVNLGFTRVYIIFLISAHNIDCSTR